MSDPLEPTLEQSQTEHDSVSELESPDLSELISVNAEKSQSILDIAVTFIAESIAKFEQHLLGETFPNPQIQDLDDDIDLNEDFELQGYCKKTKKKSKKRLFDFELEDETTER